MTLELRRCLLQDLGTKDAAIRYIRTKICSGVTEYQNAADEFERELEAERWNKGHVETAPSLA